MEGLGIEGCTHHTLGEYYRHRLRLHLTETYAGIPMQKFPEDLHTYEALLWSERINAVVEVGTAAGGSALWFRDRLLTNARYGVLDAAPRVITIDVDTAGARYMLSQVDRAYGEVIKVLQMDIRELSQPHLIERWVPPGSRVMVVEDGAHTYDTTLAALRALARFVSPGSFFVVEDGHREFAQLRLADWPAAQCDGHVLRAIREWLESDEGARFILRRDLERYIVTSHPFGFLQRLD